MEIQPLSFLQAVIVVIAILGAITGSAGLALGIANFLRDRSKVRVSLFGGRRVLNAPEYDPEKTYFAVLVANVGRRPIYLTNVSLWLPGKPWAVLHDGLRNPDTFLEGGAPKHYLVEEVLFKDLTNRWAGIRAVVWDAAGKKYVSNPLAGRPTWGDDLDPLAKLRLRLLWHWAKLRP